MTRTTIESLRETEARLTPEQLLRAISMMKNAGWVTGRDAPLWCWQEVYVEVLK